MTTVDSAAPLEYFPAALTDDQWTELEQYASSNDLGLLRRITLITCIRDSNTLLKFATEEWEAYLDAFESVTAYLEHVIAAVELSQVAVKRMALVGDYVEKGGAS